MDESDSPHAFCVSSHIRDPTQVGQGFRNATPPLPAPAMAQLVRRVKKQATELVPRLLVGLERAAVRAAGKDVEAHLRELAYKYVRSFPGGRRKKEGIDMKKGGGLTLRTNIHLRPPPPQADERERGAGPGAPQGHPRAPERRGRRRRHGLPRLPAGACVRVLRAVGVGGMVRSCTYPSTHTHTLKYSPCRRRGSRRGRRSGRRRWRRASTPRRPATR